MNKDIQPIDISDNDLTRDDDRKAEVPVIIIERDETDSTSEGTSYSDNSHKPHRRWRIISMAAAIILIATAIYALIVLRDISSYMEMPISTTDTENIAKLDAPFQASAISGIDIISDSVLGVAFDLYPLSGLAASLEPSLPDTTDTSLILFCRSADYRPDSTIIGSIAIDGNIIPDKALKSRPAYLAISPEGRPVLGVSYTDKVMEHVTKNGGAFFRQFTLLSDATLPVVFPLKGKVERAAIGKMADDRLYYIITHHKETMYDFADALREYGFMDAMYVTGGNSYSFYRDSNGIAHTDSTVNAKYQKYNKLQLIAPLLVFRSRQ